MGVCVGGWVGGWVGVWLCVCWGGGGGRSVGGCVPDSCIRFCAIFFNILLTPGTVAMIWNMSSIVPVPKSSQ